VLSFAEIRTFSVMFLMMDAIVVAATCGTDDESDVVAFVDASLSVLT
jgi:hypothetical protein